MRFCRSMSSRYARMLLLMNRLSWSLIQSLKTNARTPVVNSKKKMIPRNTENYSRRTGNDAHLGFFYFSQAFITAVCKLEVLSWNVQTWVGTCFPGVRQCILQSPEWTWPPRPPWRARLGPGPPGLWWTRCWTEPPEGRDRAQQHSLSQAAASLSGHVRQKGHSDIQQDGIKSEGGKKAAATTNTTKKLKNPLIWCTLCSLASC